MEKFKQIIFTVLPLLFLAGVLVAAGIDDAAFGPGVSRVEPFGAEFDDTAPDSVDEGDLGAVRMSANRNLYATIRDAAGNERGANVNASNQLSVVEASAASILTSVQIMDDWDESDRAKVNPIAGQAGIAANAGAMDALTTRVTLATDDTHTGAVGAASDVDGVIHGQLRYIGEAALAIQTAVEIIDDWDSSDHAKTKNVPLVWDSDNAANCAAITASSAALTLDTDSDHFKCCAWGNNAYAITGATPTATTTVTTGYSFIIADGQCHEFTTTDAQLAVIGTAAAGTYCCISMEAP